MSVFSDSTESRLIGLAGTLGAGKDTLAEHLVSKYNFLHVSTGDVLRAEASARDLDPTHRPTLIEIGIELRSIYGMGALSLRGYQQWLERREEYSGGLVVSGLRSPGEAGGIQEQKGALVFIDGPAELRYRNIEVRGRAEGTFTTFEEFVEYEQKELHGLFGPNSPNLIAVQAVSDAQIWNPGINKEEYLRNAVISLGLSD